MPDSYVTTRKQAKEIGALYYFTGKPCKSGHLSKKRTSNGSCVECYDLWKSENREWTKQHYNKWHHATKNIRGDKIRKVGRQASKQYQITHHAKVSEMGARRRAAERQAVPNWSENILIKMLYKKRDELNERYNLTLDVDHIIPLRSDTVCGLHCWDNLQLLDHIDNITKNNRYQQTW